MIMGYTNSNLKQFLKLEFTLQSNCSKHKYVLGCSKCKESRMVTLQSKSWVYFYFHKMLGKGLSRRKPNVRAAWQSFFGAFLAIAVLAFLERFYNGVTSDIMLIGSFGATSCMIFGLSQSEYAQPRNVVCGHILSALCGVTAYLLLGSIEWLACGIAVSSALALMHLSRTFHPPGGATALIAVVGGPSIQKLGYTYAFMPVAVGCIILVIMGVLINNLFQYRRYPLHWW